MLEYSPQELDVLDAGLLSGASPADLANILGRTPKAIRAKRLERVRAGLLALSQRPERWTAGLIETLKLRWAQGASASQIARELGEGFTRNSIVGKVHRLGLSNSERPPRPPIPRPRARVARPKKAQTNPKRQYHILNTDDSGWSLMSHKPDMGRVGLLDAKANECRWICDNDLCCGAYAPDLARQWCSFHASVVFRPVRVR